MLVSFSGRIDPVFTEWRREVLYPIRYKPSRKCKAEIIIKVLQTISGLDGVTFASLRQSQVSGEWVLLIDNGVVVVSFQKQTKVGMVVGGHEFPNENCRLF